MWKGNQFYYSQRLLRTIAENYCHLYEGLPQFGELIVNPWRLVEYKVDFDLALQSLGKGKWMGDIRGSFKDYSHFGGLQQIIISDIMGIEDGELERLGFYNIKAFKSYAYKLAVKFLNGGEDESRPKRNSNRSH